MLAHYCSKMAEPYISPDSRCFGCMSANDERRLLMYHVKELKFKAIFQMDKLILCYICKRIAEQMDKFIHNVEASQELLADARTDLNFNPEGYKLLLHPMVSLAFWISNPEDIVLVDGKECNQLQFEEIKDEFGVASDELTVHAERIKEEIYNEDVGSDDNLYISAIEDLNYLSEPKIKKERIKTKSSKKRIVDKDIDDSGYTSGRKINKRKDQSTPKKPTKRDTVCAGCVCITREELTAERAQKAADKKYVESTLKCEDCIKHFIMRSSYDNHMKLHDKSRGDFECDICKQRMETEAQLERHYKYHYDRYKCSQCEVTRNCYVALEDHYKRMHSENKFDYNCPYCYKQFRFRSSLQKHKMSIHDKKKMRCKHCEKVFESDSALNYHLKFNHTEEESAMLKQYVCAVCGRCFIRRPLYVKHLATHTATRDFYCVECDKSFKTRDSLNQHLKNVTVHNPDRKLILECPQCDKRFWLKKALEAHMKQVHDPTIFQCSQCGKTFKTKKHLRRHILAHEGYELPRNHCCTVCNKRFHEKNGLVKHMYSHTGEKPYQCTHCPAQFAHSGTRYTHIRTVHLNLTKKGIPKGARKPRN